MSPESHSSDHRERGFTLIEATISLTLLLIILVLSMTFLFSMRSFSQKQELFAQPRQNARRAVDYLSNFVRSATDMNSPANPNALVTWYRVNAVNGVGGQYVQATWNNVQNAALADVDTDIITLGRASNNRRISFSSWDGPGDLTAATTAVLVFSEGCGGGDPANLAALQADTPHNANNRDLLTVVDQSGNWAYFRITGYTASNCAAAQATVAIQPGGASNVYGPRYLGVVAAGSSISAGIQYMAFRVRGGILQQKVGLFDPNTDTVADTDPANQFTPLLENLEDLQIAWIYNDGTVWNDSPGHQLAGGPSNNVPTQDTYPTAVRDVGDVRGLRISITARANQEVPSQIFSRYFRPASEDRAAAAAQDKFYHYRLTSTVMVRNRMLGG